MTSPNMAASQCFCFMPFLFPTYYCTLHLFTAAPPSFLVCTANGNSISSQSIINGYCLVRCVVLNCSEFILYTVNVAQEPPS